MESQQTPPTSAGPSTSADRMRAHREKQRLMQQEAYKKPVLESAKEVIRSMDDPSVEALLAQQDYQARLDPSQVGQLKTFVKNLRALKKKEEAASLEKVKEELNFKERAQRIGNLEISELDRILVEAPSEEERVRLMGEKIEENIFVFCEYMETLKPRTEDFLRHIIEFYGKLDERKFTMLFVRVCVMHRGEKLSIKAEMVTKAMRFLVEQKTHPTAALGLLKLTYENQIPLTDFSMELLLKFQQTYENQIIHFIKSLSRVKQHVVESLPPTLFLFSKPMLGTLFAGGDILYQGIPPQFLPYIISILSYSFSEDPRVFEIFLSTFKEGCNHLYDSLIESDFQNLLQTLIDEVKQRIPRYFQNLSNSIGVIKSSFELHTEKQIARFDHLTLRQLIFGSQEVITMLQQRPKILQNATSSALGLLIQQVQALNPTLLVDEEALLTPLDDGQLSPFRALGISSLLALQELAFKILLDADKMSRTFIRYETGQGKTALCMALGVAKATQGLRALIVNQSPELTFRDFKKALNTVAVVKIQIMHLEGGDGLRNFASGVYYMSGDSFLKATQFISRDDLCRTVLIMDEFDSLLFNDGPYQVDTINQILNFPLIIGLSGSDFQVQHQAIIANNIGGNFVNMKIPSVDRGESVCRALQICDKRPDAVRSIIELASRQSNLTPVIIILDSGYDQMLKGLSQKSMRAENLNGRNGPHIEAVIATFTLKSLNKYGAFIINHDQGRGIDFPSSHEIEQAGGVYLILGCLPRNFLSYQQILGRTGRIGNRGQYSVIAYHKECKNLEGAEFLKLKLDELKNIDIHNVSRLAQTIASSRRDSSSESASLRVAVEEEKVGCDLPYTSEAPIEEIVNEQLASTLVCAEDIHLLDIQEAVVVEALHSAVECPSAASVGSQSVPKRKQKWQDKVEVASSRMHRSRDKRTVERDRQYFEGYSLPDIHREMTDDVVRMGVFDNALKQVSFGNTVIDIGAGSGVLCIMAAKAGATKVYGVEHSEYYRVALQSVHDNNLDDTIQIVNSLAEDFLLPDGKADVLISEWMGYFLVFENMLPSVLIAKEMNLREGGLIIPRRACIRIAAFDKPQAKNGIVLKALEKLTNENAIIEQVLPEKIITDSYCILDLDIDSLKSWKNTFSSKFELVSEREGTVKGLVAWFDAEMTDDITLSTSPFSPPTHWKQTVFYFSQEIEVKLGDKIVGNMNVSPPHDDHRGLQFLLEVKREDTRRPFTYQYWLQ